MNLFVYCSSHLLIEGYVWVRLTVYWQYHAWFNPLFRKYEVTGVFFNKTNLNEWVSVMRRQEERRGLIEARNEGGRELLLRLRPQSRTRSLTCCHTYTTMHYLITLSVTPLPSTVLSLEKPLISTILFILHITLLNNYSVTKRISSQSCAGELKRARNTSCA